MKKTIFVVGWYSEVVRSFDTLKRAKAFVLLRTGNEECKWDHSAAHGDVWNSLSHSYWIQTSDLYVSLTDSDTPY